MDQELTGASLAKLTLELLHDPARLRKMAENSRKAGNPQAIEKIVNVIEQLIEDCR